MAERPKELDNKVIIMNGFTYEEINKIMNAVKKLFDKPKDLIFAKTTETSVEMKLKDLIVDMSEDHEYLKKNPPQVKKQGGKPSTKPATPDFSGAESAGDGAAEGGNTSGGGS